MCRTTDYHPGSYKPEQNRLNIKAFYLYLSSTQSLPASLQSSVPESLTLLFLPQLNGPSIKINGSKIQPNLPGFITLYRIINTGSLVFGAREPIRVSEGIRFEVYVEEEKLLKGIFRRDVYEHEGGWKLECKCVSGRQLFRFEAMEAEIFIATEGCGQLREKVTITVSVNRRRRMCRKAAVLEEIPEEREVEDEYEEKNEKEGCSFSTCRCSDNGGIDSGSETEDVDDRFEDGMDTEMEMEMMEQGMEGVRWAIDAGIWVMCLGVGYLVSRASVKRLRRRRIL